MSALSKVLAIVLTLAAVVFAPSRLVAHESALAVLELREMRPGAYIGRWTMEPKIGAQSVRFRAPPHCFVRLPELNCGKKGLVGALTIDNLGANMSAVLIKILPVEGPCFRAEKMRD